MADHQQPYCTFCDLPPELIIHILEMVDVDDEDVHAVHSVRASCTLLRNVFDANCRRVIITENAQLTEQEDVVALVRRLPSITSLNIQRPTHRRRNGPQVVDWGRVLAPPAVPLLDDVSVNGCVGLDLRALVEPCAGHLKRLEVLYGDGVDDVNAVTACTQLEALRIYDFPTIKRLPVMLPPLLELDISYCHALSAIAVPPTLRKLRVYCCDGLLRCTDIATALEDLEIRLCESLTSIGGTGDHLVRVDVSGNRSLSDIDALLANGRALRHLDVRGTSVTDIGFVVGCVGLRHLESGHSHVTDIGGLRGCPELMHVSLVCSDVRNIDVLRTCTSLQCLILDDCRDVADIRALATCTSLMHVSLVNCASVANIAPLASSRATLQHLDLYKCASVGDVSVLKEGFASLEFLNLHSCRGVGSVEALVGCPSLIFVDLSMCDALTNVDVLAGCPFLKELSVDGCSKIASIGGGVFASTLERLSLRGTAIADLVCVARCTALRWLDIGRCTALTDLGRSLTGLVSLKMLNLGFCASVSGVLDLTGCRMLENLVVSHTSVIGIDPPASLETIDISFTPIEDIGALRICERLKDVMIFECPNLSDFGVHVVCESVGMYVECLSNGVRMLWRKPVDFS